MHKKQLRLLNIFLLTCIISFSQDINKNKINTSAAQAYFKIAHELEKGGNNENISWQILFKTLPYKMMIDGNAIDTIDFKSKMKQAFSLTSNNMNTSPLNDINYHHAYKDNQKELEIYIKQLNTGNIVDSVKNLLYPYLPMRLQKPELFPILIYMNYGSAEATGFGGIVINDLLHSYIIDKFKFGLLSAHEAFHSIVSSAFQQKIKKNIGYDDSDFNLLYFLENVSEEGIADLIDKPLLLQTNSPLYNQVKQMTVNDDSLSKTLIYKLDNFLTLANQSEKAFQEFGDFTTLANTFGKNGGHIPGRFMADVIKRAGLLQNHIDTIEDPISFILHYNNATKMTEEKYPFFSNESILYLQKLRNKYWVVN